MPRCWGSLYTQLPLCCQELQLLESVRVKFRELLNSLARLREELIGSPWVAVSAPAVHPRSRGMHHNGSSPLPISAQELDCLDDGSSAMPLSVAVEEMAPWLLMASEVQVLHGGWGGKTLLGICRWFIRTQLFSVEIRQWICETTFFNNDSPIPLNHPAVTIQIRTKPELPSGCNWSPSPIIASVDHLWLQPAGGRKPEESIAGVPPGESTRRRVGFTSWRCHGGAMGVPGISHQP